MKILIANELGSVLGGRETYLQELIPYLRRAGHDLGFAFGQLPGAEAPSIVGGDRGPVWRLPEDRAKIVAWKPDVVYLHGLSDPDAEGMLAADYPTVYFPHGYYGTCISGTKCYSRAGHQPCRRALGPGCLAAYLPRGCGGWNPATMLTLYRAQRRHGANLHQYRTVLVASRHMADEYRRHGVEESRLHVMPLFPTSTTPASSPPSPRTRSGRVLFVGRMTSLKGLIHLVRALPVAAEKLGRRLTLVAAGDGPERAEAEAAARTAGLGAEFLGWIDAERREAEMRKADLLAVPSVWPEPFGLVGIEAGCVGLPSVAFAVGGIPDWLIPGVSGESAPGDRPNPQQLADAFVRALADDVHWNRLRLGAWETARRFTPEAHMDRLIPILEAARS